MNNIIGLILFRSIIKQPIIRWNKIKFQTFIQISFELLEFRSIANTEYGEDDTNTYMRAILCLCTLHHILLHFVSPNSLNLRPNFFSVFSEILILNWFIDLYVKVFCFELKEQEQENIPTSPSFVELKSCYAVESLNKPELTIGTVGMFWS